jgi:hypothetical protein
MNDHDQDNIECPNCGSNSPVCPHCGTVGWHYCPHDYWERFSVFITAFAEITQLSLNEARDQWAGFSVQLSDTERQTIEYGGEQSGYQQGALFNECFPPEDEEA